MVLNARRLAPPLIREWPMRRFNGVVKRFGKRIYKGSLVAYGLLKLVSSGFCECDSHYVVRLAASVYYSCCFALTSVNFVAV